MKKFLLTFLILSVFSSTSQTGFNRAYHTSGDVGGTFLVKIDNEYYSGITNRSASISGTYLYKHDKNGNLKSKTHINGTQPISTIKTFDKKLLIMGRYNWCDVHPGYEMAYLLKVDTNGTQIFFVSDTLGQLGAVSALIQYSDSTYYFVSDSVLYRHDKNGQFLSKVNLGFSSILAAIELPNHNVLLSAKQNNNPCLITITPSGATVSVKSFPVLISKFEFYGGQKLIGVGDDSRLHRISVNQGHISQSNFANNFDVTDFYVQNDSVYVTLNSSVQSAYAIIDTAFNGLNFKSTIVQGFHYGAICAGVDNRIAILSSGEAKLNGSWMDNDYYSSLYVIDKSETIDFVNDVALVSTFVDSIYYSGYVYVKLRARVKNEGTTIVNSFKLNCFEIMTFDGCSRYFYQEEFTNLNLQPGDSVELSPNSPIMLMPGSISGNTVTGYFCLYTSLPNKEVDNFSGNNQLCKNFSTTGIEETGSILNSLKIFPNPSEKDFTIKASAMINSVEVYNVIGELISSESLTGQEIRIGDRLDAGVYFLKINTDKGTITKKVLKN